MNGMEMAAAALCGLASGAAGAQTTMYWPAPTTAASAQPLYLPMGTPLALVTRTQVSTKDNKAGDRLYLDVAESLSYRGQVVIPAGSVAVAEVARSDRNGHLGKKGVLDINLLYVETPNGPVRLTGRANDEGTSGLIASVATIALVSPLGYFIHGTSAHLAHGTPVKAYLAEDLRFTMHAPAVAATVVQPDAPRAVPASYDQGPVSVLVPVQTAQR